MWELDGGEPATAQPPSGAVPDADGEKGSVFPQMVIQYLCPRIGTYRTLWNTQAGAHRRGDCDPFKQHP